MVLLLPKTTPLFRLSLELILFKYSVYYIII